jgi:hypothetical protein
MLFRDELPPQEQLNVVMRTVQLERGKICRTQILAGTSPEGEIASDLVRANLSINNFLRRGQQEDLNSMATMLFLKQPLCEFRGRRL